jgi:hypothetical protein
MQLLKHTLSTKLETFLLDLKDGATAVVRFLLRKTDEEKKKS